MKKVGIAVSITFAIVIAFILGGASITKSLAATTEESNALDKKIYVCDNYIGFALNELEANSLVRQSALWGYEDTPFLELIKNGKEVKEGNLTFVIAKGTDLTISDGFSAYEVGDIGLSRLVSGELKQAEFELSERISTAYGEVNIYSHS